MIELEPRIRSAAENIFLLEHRRFAARLGLRDDKPERLASGGMVVDLIYAIDELAWSEGSLHKRLAIQMIALAWEHASQVLRADLREFFVVALSRLGVSPATIMLDPEYRTQKKYSALNSYSAELATVALQLPFQVRVGGICYQLTRFQRKAFDSIEANRLTGISAPTSAGKSFAIYLAIIGSALRVDRPIVYIVPTISLVNQVSADLRGRLDAHGLESWTVANTFHPGDERAIFVLTQERAIVALDNGLATEKLSILVVDEVQNLERVTSDDELRSKILYDFLHDMRHADLAEKIILSGPRLDNIGVVGEDIFGIPSADERAIESPVASITYAIERLREGEYVINQYRDALGTKFSLKITNGGVIKGAGQSAYTDDYYSYLNHLMTSLGDGSKNLVFSPTAAQARKIAARLAGYSGAQRGTPGLLELSSYLANSIHPKHSLVDKVRSGVAFHSGSVPPHARLVIEQAFSEGLLKDVVCTTTLMQGVNLPADVVLIRSPRLYVKKQAGSDGVELSAYEFANLRGRAGRLLRDFVGRTVVLDEGSFRQDGQAELFADTHKNLALGYGGIFSNGREEILAELREPGAAESDGAKFMATFIRQTAIRYPKTARGRLENVGIHLHDGEFQRMQSGLNDLDVDNAVVISNRYWDPFDLQKIKDHLDGGRLGKLPNDIWFKGGLANVLHKFIEFQSVISPTYYRRLLGGKASDKYFMHLALSAESWGREVPLRTIIEDRHFTDDVDDRIDDQLDIIYKKVIYGLTALLKPVAAIQGSGAALIAAIESGVYHPITQLLISQGMYRETAVHLRRTLLGGISGDSQDLRPLVSKRVLDGLDSLDPWTRRQVMATTGRQL